MTVAESIRSTTEELLLSSEDYFLIGEGITDQKGAFGTTINLHQKFPGRVFDMPISEAGVTGVCLGAAINGMRPIMVHMRADFLLYAADQIINNIAKWYAMFGGNGGSVPMIIRAVIGRGWGQGMQHSQHLEELFAMVPGIKVVMPSNAQNARALLLESARGNNPVLYLEHRWIHELKHNVSGDVRGETEYGSGDCVVTASGYMLHECIKAKSLLEQQSIYIKVRDRLDISPSVDGDIFITETPFPKSTGRLSPEFTSAPPSFGLSSFYYPTVVDICHEVARFYKTDFDDTNARQYVNSKIHDIPNPDFRGPF